MARYRKLPKPKYVPLKRFIFARSIDDFPSKVKHFLKRSKAKLGFIALCDYCGQQSMMCFHVEDPENPGNIYVCGNPECDRYEDPEWFPLKGGP